MSFSALNWACSIRDPSVSAGARHVLLTLAQFADEHQTCYPSHAALAAITNLSPDTVQRRIKDLIEHGLVFVVKRKNNDGRRLTNYYVLLVDAAARAHALAHGMAEDGSEREAEDDQPAGRGIDQPAGCGMDHAAGCGMDHAAGETDPCRRVHETMPQLCGIEPSNNHQITLPPTPHRGEGGGASRKLSDDDQARLDRWQAFRKVWPWDAAELVAEARAVFLRLSTVEQQAAIDAAPRYVAACRERETRARNHGIAHAKRWLSGEGWAALKARSAESAASLAGRPFAVRQGSPQAAAWAQYEAAVNGAPRLKFFHSNALGMICMRPTEWPPSPKLTGVGGPESARDGPEGQGREA
ncbi:MAG: helix-turn-helix domain-containing protein [Methylocystis sp.]|uniref:helix-turn-helix domain-containing protein n=1 Tax=Methylocystis sp. TaxID=1911079 RepID=UPI003DA33D64